MDSQEMFSLKDKAIVLTGASGLLGSAIAKGLAKAQATLILNGRNQQKVLALANSLRNEGAQVYECVADITDTQQMQSILTPILEKVEVLYGLINNAYTGQTATLENSTKEQFSKAYEIAVGAPFELIQHCLPYLRRAAKLQPFEPSIVNIGSMYATVSPDPQIYGESGFNNPPFYGSAKAGLTQLSRYLACHLAKEGIRVNTISPGPFVQDEVACRHPEFYSALCNKIPMNRVGKPAEMIGPLLFLLSSASTFVTGANLTVDGGWTAW